MKPINLSTPYQSEGILVNLEEGVGFEPTRRFTDLIVFKTIPLNHLGTLPIIKNKGRIPFGLLPCFPVTNLTINANKGHEHIWNVN